MNVTQTVARMVPTLKCNNRNRALAFFEGMLGMKNLLEDGAWTALGDASKVEKLTLEETPSNRTRAVRGVKKLSKLVVRVAVASEIEALLARGVTYTKLYKGIAGYAFEALSPEGDCILLHAEEDRQNLSESEDASFSEFPQFAGLTSFEVEEVQLNVPNLEQARAFYQQILADFPSISFVEAEGVDLQVPVEETWDLSQLKFILTDFQGSLIQQVFPQAFLAKSEKFVTLDDPSQIELWFEGL